MSLKTRFLLGALLIVLAALLAMWFSPTAVSNGVRWWAWWKASREGLVLPLEKLEAPFLRRLVFRGFALAGLPRIAYCTVLIETHAILVLILSSIFLHTH